MQVVCEKFLIFLGGIELMSPYFLLLTVGLSVFQAIWAASLLWKDTSVHPLWGFFIILLMPIVGVLMMVLFDFLKSNVPSLEQLVSQLYFSCILFFSLILLIVYLIQNKRNQIKRKASN